MAYTPIPVILDRMLSDSIKYERQTVQELYHAPGFHPEIDEHMKRATLLVNAQQRIRKQYKFIG